MEITLSLRDYLIIVLTEMLLFCRYLRQIITYASIVCYSVPTKCFVLGTLNYKDEETMPSF